MGICKSCGKPLEDGAKFCPSCGAVATSEEQMSKQENIVGSEREGQTEKKKKSFFKTPLFIGLVALLLGGGVLAAALLMNKSPKESYLYSEYKTYEKTMEETKEKYGETFEFQDKMMKEPSTSSIVLSGDFEMDSAAGDPTYDMVREMLQAIDISMEMNQDPKKKETYMKLGLNMEGESTIEAEVYQSDDKMGLSVPVLYDTFFYMNSDEYGEFMRMFDPAYSGPEEYNMNTLDFEDIKLTEKEKKYLQETYVKFIYENLDEKYFSEKKNVDFKHEGVKLELRELTLKMSPKESKEFLTKFADQLIEDKKLHDMLVKRAELVYEQVAFAEEGVPAFDEKELKDGLVDGLKEMKSGIKDLDIKKGLTSKILVDKDNIIINRDMSMEIGDTSIAINSKDVPDGDKKRYQEASIAFAETGNSGEKIVFSADNAISYKDGGRTEDMKVGFEMEGTDEGAMSFTMKSDFDGESAKKQKVDRTFALTLVEQGSEETSIKGSIKQSNDVNAKENYSKDAYTIEVEIEDEYESGKFTLNIDSNSKIQDKVKMPDLSDGAAGTTNAVDLTQEDIMVIYEEVLFNLMDVAEAFGLDPYELLSGGYYDDGSYDDAYYDDDSYYEEEAFESYDDSTVELEEEATDL